MEAVPNLPTNDDQKRDDDLTLVNNESSEQDQEPDEQDSETDKRHEEIIREAMARFHLAEESSTDLRRNYINDYKFRAGEQWPEGIEKRREIDGRPCLVINRLPQFVQQVTNDQRQNRPVIKVHPVGDGADAETAKVIQGLIKHIEYNSNAEVAYDTSFESAATGGFGFFRILTSFIAPDSFDQDIYIKRIRDPLSVFFDPFSQEPDGSDANWAFVINDLSIDDYKSQYPNSKLAGKDTTDWQTLGNQEPIWVKTDGCRVAEYFYKEMREETICLLSNGLSVPLHEVNDHISSAAQAGLQVSVAKSRATKIPMIKWCKINGIEVLEETEWPISFIPIIPVYGAEIFVDGKRILESVIRHAKDPQRMYNYWASAETEAIALAPKAPFIVAEGQIEGYEKQWAEANQRNYAYLPFKPVTVAGQMAPPPMRQSFEPAVQAITHARMIAADDMKATTGIYDASLGNQSADTSGIAIQRRNHQAQTSNFHFTDNLTRSLRHAGRILIDLIPHIYDTIRTARIIAEDGTQTTVKLNETYHDEKTGKDVLYTLSVGRYDVTVDTGPSFASRRQEAAVSMMDLSRSYPQIMGIAGDLMVKNMDWPGAEDVADRIKKTLPPALQADSKQQQVPPQVQAQMSQMGQMIDQLTQHLHETTQILQTKKLDLEHRERVEIMKLQVEAEIELAKLGSKGDLALLKHEVESITKRMNMIGNNIPIGADDPNFNQAPDSNGGMPASPNSGGAQSPTGGAQPSPGQPMGAF